MKHPVNLTFSNTQVINCNSTNIAKTSYRLWYNGNVAKKCNVEKNPQPSDVFYATKFKKHK